MATTAQTRYQVTAACVMAKVNASIVQTLSGKPSNTTGMTFYRDALLPDNINADDLARLIRKGMVKQVTIGDDGWIKEAA